MDLRASIGEVSEVNASIVSGARRADHLRALSEKVFGVPLHVATVKPNWRGLSSCYENPLMLGVDRWLVMLAARQHTPDAMSVIIDSGTAMTVDVVNNEGCHEGGFIVPGLGLMADSLFARAAHLNGEKTPAGSVRLGRVSLECIQQGALAMAVAFVEAQCQRSDSMTLFLTGGDAQYIKPHLSVPCVYWPDMVMDGLALAAKEA